MSLRSVFFGFALLVSAVFLLQSAENPASAADQTHKIVRTAAVEWAEQAQALPFSGWVRATDRADLAPLVSGRLLSRSVDVGQVVKKDQILAQLDPEPFQHALASAHAKQQELQSQWDQSMRDLTRLRQLVDQKAAPLEELEHVEMGAQAMQAGLQAAQAQVQEAKRQLAECTLRAPFSGTISQVFLEPGNLAATGQPIFSLTGNDGLEIALEVPEFVVDQLALGQDVEIRNDRPIQKGVGRITSISRANMRPGQLFSVLVHLDKGPFFAGQSVEVHLKLQQEIQPTVPIGAVINPTGETPQLIRVRDQAVQKVPVRVEGIQGQRVAVIGDLKLGDLVVIGGFFGLNNGDRVEVVQ